MSNGQKWITIDARKIELHGSFDGKTWTDKLTGGESFFRIPSDMNHPMYVKNDKHEAKDA
jgi:hypothetical protein